MIVSIDNLLFPIKLECHMCQKIGPNIKIVTKSLESMFDGELLDMAAKFVAYPIFRLHTNASTSWKSTIHVEFLHHRLCYLASLHKVS